MDILLVLLFVSTAFAQTGDIVVESPSFCWENETAGVWMLKNCGFGEDYLRTSLMGWEWVTGGFISMFLVALLVIIVWVKYHKVSYALLVGVIFLPITAQLFFDEFLIMAIIMAFAGIGIWIWYTFIRQAKEY